MSRRFVASITGLPGYPVEVTLEARIGSQRMEVTQTLQQVDKTDVGGDRFEVPAGYTKVPSPFDGLLGGATGTAGPP